MSQPAVTPPPTVWISADTLLERCQFNAIGVELRDATGNVRAYEVHGRRGPWLATVPEWSLYRSICHSLPNPQHLPS